MDATPLAWTPEHVARFWSYWSDRPDRHSTYFAYQVGRGVCNFLRHVVPLRDQRILDYGAGPGYLTGSLLRHGACVSAVEYSSSCVAGLNQRFDGDPSWEGAKLFTGNRLPFEDNCFDVVCCLETIEHILPEHLDRVLSELQRVTKPRGIVLLTTPNSENLRDQTVFCPHCCHEFHRWQHVRQWTAPLLEQQLTDLGYDVRFCRGLSFHDFQPPPLRARHLASLRRWRNGLAELAALTSDRIAKAKFPNGQWLQRRLRSNSVHHLVAVASKRSETSRDESANPPMRAA